MALHCDKISYRVVKCHCFEYDCAEFGGQVWESNGLLIDESKRQLTLIVTHWVLGVTNPWVIDGELRYIQGWFDYSAWKQQMETDLPDWSWDPQKALVLWLLAQQRLRRTCWVGSWRRNREWYGTRTFPSSLCAGVDQIGRMKLCSSWTPPF